VRNGRRQPALPSRDTVARFLARLADGALGGALLARPLALISRLPEHVCRLAGTTLVLALSSVAQGFRPPGATLLLAAMAISGLAAAELLRPRSALAALALALATHAYVPALLGLAWAVGKPVPLSALRFSGSRHASAASFPGRVARYLVLSAAYWALLLYGSDRIVAFEVYRPGREVLRLSIGQFAASLARWSTARAAWSMARGRLRGDGTPVLLLVREALHAAFGPFSQLCLVPTLLEDGAARTGRETPRVCCSVADFTPRERPMRPADARRVLGVGPFADGHAIRKAYRRLALKYHPDKLRAQGDRARASAEREFLRVQAAHQLLTKGAEKASA
jgi:DnaJ-domain-containing protein 1